MTTKIPKATLKELDRLMVQLSKNNNNDRAMAMSRLRDFEKSGTISVESMLEMADAKEPTVSMYAITALGRNGSAKAVAKLLTLADQLATGNVLLQETVVEALGDASDREATPLLLGLIGIQIKGWTSRLIGKLVKKNDEITPEMERRRKHLTLPVIKALEKISDPRAAELLGDHLKHEDHFVRWHVIQILVACNWSGFNEQLREMAGSDENKLVQEMAEIALEKINKLPPHMNN